MGKHLINQRSCDFPIRQPTGRSCTFLSQLSRAYSPQFLRGEIPVRGEPNPEPKSHSSGRQQLVFFYRHILFYLVDLSGCTRPGSSCRHWMPEPGEERGRTADGRVWLQLAATHRRSPCFLPLNLELLIPHPLKKQRDTPLSVPPIYLDS